ncbi:MAG: hypothetical protein ACLQBK_06210 [Candidatus Sulfotelmatobacter sp.]
MGTSAKQAWKAAGIVALLWMANSASAQTSSPATAEQNDISGQVRELRTMVEELRDEGRASRAEIQQLRQELQSTRAVLERFEAVNQTQPPTVAASPQTSATLPSGAAQPATEEALASRVERLEDSTALLAAKVDEQHQTKIEAAGKYRVRLSGIVLMNAFHNHGTADNFDFPSFAAAIPWTSPSGFGATLRQSEVGLEVFGPDIAGAKTSADVHLDFAGNLTWAPNGVSFGSARLKTASLRLDWEHTSVIAGQDQLFISPLSPTSFASLATPAFAYAGNLWGWIPQIRVEHRFDLTGAQKVTVQAGIMDNLVWEMPSGPYNRTPGPGEQSGQPAYALRTAWSHAVRDDREVGFGVSGYYSRQDWSFERYVDGWAGIADWHIPLISGWTLSGEFYRGRGAGGLGAGIGRTVLYGSAPEYGVAPIRGADSAGGWSQLKWQITPKLELNGAFGEDDLFSADVRGFASDAGNNGPILGRNRAALGNLVLRPRSDLVLSAEYRRLRSFPVYEPSLITNQINLAMGILF